MVEQVPRPQSNLFLSCVFFYSLTPTSKMMTSIWSSTKQRSDSDKLAQKLSRSPLSELGSKVTKSNRIYFCYWARIKHETMFLIAGICNPSVRDYNESDLHNCSKVSSQVMAQSTMGRFWKGLHSQGLARHHLQRAPCTDVITNKETWEFRFLKAYYCMSHWKHVHWPFTSVCLWQQQVYFNY